MYEYNIEFIDENDFKTKFKEDYLKLEELLCEFIPNYKTEKEQFFKVKEEVLEC